jgi:hypothetical protein
MGVIKSVITFSKSQTDISALITFAKSKLSTLCCVCCMCGNKIDDIFFGYFNLTPDDYFGYKVIICEKCDVTHDSFLSNKESYIFFKDKGHFLIKMTSSYEMDK